MISPRQESDFHKKLVLQGFEKKGGGAAGVLFNGWEGGEGHIFFCLTPSSPFLPPQTLERGSTVRTPKTWNAKQFFWEGERGGQSQTIFHGASCFARQPEGENAHI